MSERPPKHFKSFERDEEGRGITSSELDYILDVNKKAIEIQLEVEQQNEEVLTLQHTIIEKLDELLKDKAVNKTEAEQHHKEQLSLSDKIEEIERNIFRLTIVLSSAGVGAILTIIQALLHH